MHHQWFECTNLQSLAAYLKAESKNIVFFLPFILYQNLFLVNFFEPFGQKTEKIKILIGYNPKYFLKTVHAVCRFQKKIHRRRKDRLKIPNNVKN